MTASGSDDRLLPNELVCGICGEGASEAARTCSPKGVLNSDETGRNFRAGKADTWGGALCEPSSAKCSRGGTRSSSLTLEDAPGDTMVPLEELGVIRRGGGIGFGLVIRDIGDVGGEMVGTGTR